MCLTNVWFSFPPPLLHSWIFWEKLTDCQACAISLKIRCFFKTINFCQSKEIFSIVRFRQTRTKTSITNLVKCMAIRDDGGGCVSVIGVFRGWIFFSRLLIQPKPLLSCQYFRYEFSKQYAKDCVFLGKCFVRFSPFWAWLLYLEIMPSHSMDALRFPIFSLSRRTCFSFEQYCSCSRCTSSLLRVDLLMTEWINGKTITLQTNALSS